MPERQPKAVSAGQTLPVTAPQPRRQPALCGAPGREEAAGFIGKAGGQGWGRGFPFLPFFPCLRHSLP